MSGEEELTPLGKDAAPPPLVSPDVSPVEDPAYRTFLGALSYLKKEEVAQVRDAYAFAEKAHRGQSRLSGEPYIIHPLAVATTLAGWHMDVQAVNAALLHDVMEDTPASKEEIAELFGKKVADLVDGVSKLERIEFQTYQAAQAENFRKMMMSMSRDLRVVLIKLADRFHNLQTMAPFRPEKRRRIAHETLDIYAPIATRLGLNNLSRQLQDLSFMHIHPARFQVLAKALKAVRGNRRELLSKILEGIRSQLHDNQIEADVFGREKNLYSIYHKMREKHLSFAQVLDIYGFRIIVSDIPACYLALGVLHARYKPVPGKIKDYIAIPKNNGYRSLHTTLIGPYGTPMEIQIRTEKMHHLAEEGVASHWLYKDEDSGQELQDKTRQWLQSLIEAQGAAVDSSEFLENIKEDLFPEEVYVFTPKGKIFVLPRGATVVDFAYAVHTDVGHRCVAARINHEPVSLSTELLNGNQVEIITSSEDNPNPEWLNYTQTGRARGKIRQFLKQRYQDGSSVLGEDMLNRELQSIGVVPSEIPAAIWERVVNDAGKHSKQELFADIGLGRSLAPMFAKQLAAYDEVAQSEARSESPPLLIKGIDGILIRLATCCQPIPRAPIVGQIYQDQGLIIHAQTCSEAIKMRQHNAQNWILTEWSEQLEQFFSVRLKITARNAQGMLARVATAISEASVNIEQVSSSRDNGLVTNLYFLVQVASRAHLANLMRSVRRLPEVERIARERDSA